MAEPQRRRGVGCLGRSLGIAIGIVIGGLVLILIIVALIGAGLDEAEEEAEKARGVVRVETPANVCWSGAMGPVTRDGCGPQEVEVDDLAAGIFSANAQKRTPGADALTLVLLINGAEADRATTTAEFGVAQVSGNVRP